ncbi:MAG: hypothetical protein AAFM92_06995 [Pseudomonadota bacterium]
MIRGAVLCLVLWAGTAMAGVAKYEACLGDGYEARVMATFSERFPHERCTGPDCDPRLMKTATALTRAACRDAALADCASTKCRDGLSGRWSSEAATVRADIERALRRVDIDALPALQARRLSTPARWLSPHSCTGDAAACAADAAGQALGDLERLYDEVSSLR